MCVCVWNDMVITMTPFPPPPPPPPHAARVSRLALIMKNSLVYWVWDCTSWREFWWMMGGGICQPPTCWSPQIIEDQCTLWQKHGLWAQCWCIVFQIAALRGSAQCSGESLTARTSVYFKGFFFFFYKRYQFGQFNISADLLMQVVLITYFFIFTPLFCSCCQHLWVS